MLGQAWKKEYLERCGMLCVMQVLVGAKPQKDPNFVTFFECVRQVLWKFINFWIISKWIALRRSEPCNQGDCLQQRHLILYWTSGYPWPSDTVIHTKPSSVPAWNFYYGPIPLHNRMDTYCAKWAIPWNSGVMQFKKGPHPPPLCLGWMEGRLTTDDGTDGWKGRPPRDIIF